MAICTDNPCDPIFLSAGYASVANTLIYHHFKAMPKSVLTKVDQLIDTALEIYPRCNKTTVVILRRNLAVALRHFSGPNDKALIKVITAQSKQCTGLLWDMGGLSEMQLLQEQLSNDPDIPSKVKRTLNECAQFVQTGMELDKKWQQLEKSVDNPLVVKSEKLKDVAMAERARTSALKKERYACEKGATHLLAELARHHCEPSIVARIRVLSMQTKPAQQMRTQYNELHQNAEAHRPHLTQALPDGLRQLNAPALLNCTVNTANVRFYGLLLIEWRGDKTKHLDRLEEACTYLAEHLDEDADPQIWSHFFYAALWINRYDLALNASDVLSSELRATYKTINDLAEISTAIAHMQSAPPDLDSAKKHIATLLQQNGIILEDLDNPEHFTPEVRKALSELPISTSLLSAYLSILIQHDQTVDAQTIQRLTLRTQLLRASNAIIIMGAKSPPDMTVTIQHCLQLSLFACPKSADTVRATVNILLADQPYNTPGLEQTKALSCIGTTKWSDLQRAQHLLPDIVSNHPNQLSVLIDAFCNQPMDNSQDAKQLVELVRTLWNHRDDGFRTQFRLILGGHKTLKLDALGLPDSALMEFHSTGLATLIPEYRRPAFTQNLHTYWEFGHDQCHALAVTAQLPEFSSSWNTQQQKISDANWSTRVAELKEDQTNTEQIRKVVFGAIVKHIPITEVISTEQMIMLSKDLNQMSVLLKSLCTHHLPILDTIINMMYVAIDSNPDCVENETFNEVLTALHAYASMTGIITRVLNCCFTEALHNAETPKLDRNLTTLAALWNAVEPELPITKAGLFAWHLNNRVQNYCTTYIENVEYPEAIQAVTASISQLSKADREELLRHLQQQIFYYFDVLTKSHPADENTKTLAANLLGIVECARRTIYPNTVRNEQTTPEIEYQIGLIFAHLALTSPRHIEMARHTFHQAMEMSSPDSEAHLEAQKELAELQEYPRR